MNTSTLSLTIQLPKFEGPLALLLYLIRKDEMDIFDIEINKITAQYLDFIRMMKELDLEVAGEFVAMASTLIQIKSRMLLPQYDEHGEIVENAEDPRKELVQRLLEYQKYQEAAKSLYERPLMGRDFWGRGTREKFEERIQEEIELEENALFSLISAYRRSYRAALKRVHKVSAKAQSIASRILEMKDRLIIGSRVGLSEFITGNQDKKLQVLITFLATLELAKMGFVRLFQSDTYQEIHIETVAQIETAAVSKVEEYESLHNEQGDGAETLAPLTYDSVPDAPAENAQMEFELKDDALEPEESAEPLFSEEDMASDDEILAAENELNGIVAGAPEAAPLEKLSDAEVVALLEASPFETLAADAHLVDSPVALEEPVLETAAVLETQPEGAYVMEYEMPEATIEGDEVPAVESVATTETLTAAPALEVTASVGEAAKAAEAAALLFESDLKNDEVKDVEV